MSAFEFMSANPWLTFFLATIAGWAFVAPFGLFFRHLSIRKHGWPPPHVESSEERADG